MLFLPKLILLQISFYRLSKCSSFNQSLELDTSLGSILVTCRNNAGHKVYSNIHVLIPRNKTVLRRLESWHEKDKKSRPPNVILFGIDSVSRMNLIRTMPKTAKHLHESGWFEMAGYNKVSSSPSSPLLTV